MSNEDNAFNTSFNDFIDQYGNDVVSGADLTIRERLDKLAEKSFQM